METSDISVSTSVCVGKVDTNFELDTIYHYSKIDSELRGIKYLSNTKGNINNKNSFYNQLTVKVFVKKYNKEINIKIFSNGKIQITGIKNETQAKAAIQIFLDKIKNIKGVTTKEVIVQDNLYYDKKNYELYTKPSDIKYNVSINIYGHNSQNVYKIIGERKKTGIFFDNIRLQVMFDYIKDKQIEGDIPDIFKFLYVSYKHSNLEKKIFNIRGEYTGVMRFVFFIKRKNLILFKCSFKLISNEPGMIVYHIINKNSKVIGKCEILLNEMIKPKTFEKTIDVMYSSMSNQDTLNLNLKTTNINFNFFVNFGDTVINRSRFNEILCNKYKLHSYYNVDNKYPGINLKMKLGDINNTTDSTNITYLIFQNGKILVSGATQKNQFHCIKKFIVDIITKEYTNIVNKKVDVDITDKNITIWDIL